MQTSIMQIRGTTVQVLKRFFLIKYLLSLYSVNLFLRRGCGRFWGQFPTYKEAYNFLPPRRRVVYDEDRVVPISLESFLLVHLFDWPILFHLQGLIHDKNLRRITDFGGHIGVKYRAFRDILVFPDDLRWQVIDVPALRREGERLAREDNLPALQFYAQPEDTEPCDVLLCSGVLQYSDISLEALVRRLPRLPPLILINKVAVSDAGPYYTLEDFGPGRMVYRVFGVSELEDIRKALGYDKIADWTVPYRDLVIHGPQGDVVAPMIGEAWHLSNVPEGFQGKSH